MRHAEKIEFVGDENGWEMHVTDDQGQAHRFNIHECAWELAQHACETIGAWRAEGESVRREMQASAGDNLTSDGGDADPPGGLERLRDSGALDLARDLARGK